MNNVWATKQIYSFLNSSFTLQASSPSMRQALQKHFLGAKFRVFPSGSGSSVHLLGCPAFP